MGKKFSSLIVAILAVCFCFSSASFAEEDSRLVPKKAEENLKIGGSIYSCLKSYEDNTKGNYYWTNGIDFYPENKIVFEGKGFLVAPLIKLQSYSGKGPKRKDNKSPWTENVFRPMSGTIIKTTNSTTKLSAGANTGDKEGAVVEGEWNLNSLPFQMPMTSQFLANREFKYNADYFRARSNIRPLKLFNKLEIGAGGVIESWRKEKNGKASSHTRPGAEIVCYTPTSSKTSFEVGIGCLFSNNEGTIYNGRMSLNF